MAEEDPLVQALLGQGGGGDAEGEFSGWRPPRNIWQKATDPLKAIFAVGRNIPAQLARTVLPEAYERAAKAQAKALRVGPASDAITRAEALPHLGDVLAESGAVPPALTPLVRTAGGFVDPVALIPAARAAKLVEPIVGPIASAVGRSVAGEAGAALAQRAAVAGTTFPFTAAAGLAYAPELVEGISESAGHTVKALQSGDIGETTQAALATAGQAAMAALVAHGVTGEVREARNVIKGWPSGARSQRGAFPAPLGPDVPAGFYPQPGPPAAAAPPAAPTAAPPPPGPTVTQAFPPMAGPVGAGPVFHDAGGFPEVFSETAPVSKSVQRGRAAAAGAPMPESPTAETRVAEATSVDVGTDGAGQGSVASEGPPANFPPPVAVPPQAPPPVAPVAAAPQAPAAPAPLAVGQAVRHPKYGEGIIEKLEGGEAEVRFGKKLVSLPEARLEPLAPAQPLPAAPPVAAAAPPPAAPPSAPPAPAKRAKGPTAALADLDAFEALMARKYGTPGWRDSVEARAQEGWIRDVEAHDALIAAANRAGEGGPPPAAAAPPAAAPGKYVLVRDRKTGAMGVRDGITIVWEDGAVGSAQSRGRESSQIEAVRELSQAEGRKLLGQYESVAAGTEPVAAAPPAARTPPDEAYQAFMSKIAALPVGEQGAAIEAFAKEMGLAPRDVLQTLMDMNPMAQAEAAAGREIGLRQRAAVERPPAAPAAPRPAPTEAVERAARAIADDPFLSPTTLNRAKFAEAHGLSAEEVEQALARAQELRSGGSGSAPPAAAPVPVRRPEPPPEQPPAAAEAVIPAPEVPPVSAVAPSAEVPVPRVDTTISTTETRPVRRQPWEVPDVPQGRATYPPPAREGGTPPPVATTRGAPPLPRDLGPDALRVIEENIVELRTMADRVARGYPGAGPEGVDAAWQAIYAAARSFDPAKGKFLPRATQYAKRDLALLAAKNKGGPVGVKKDFDALTGAARVEEPVGGPKAGFKETGVVGPKGDPLLAEIEKSVGDVRDYTERVAALREHLDKETDGALSAATEGRSYKEFAKEKGLTEGNAQKVYNSLGARVRALADAYGLPIQAGEFRQGELYVPESSANEIGRQTAGWAKLPEDISELGDLKGTPRAERWGSLSEGIQNEIKRAMQRLAFGYRAGGERSPLREWIRMLEQTGSIEPVKFGKKADVRGQAESVASQVFGVQPDEWFGATARSEFDAWRRRLAFNEREGLPPGWNLVDPEKNRYQIKTAAGLLPATARKAFGNWVVEPSAKLWGDKLATEIGADEIKGVLDRLGAVIKERGLEPGNILAIPDSFKQHREVWESFKNRFLKENDVGRQGSSTLYAVRDQGGSARPPFARAQMDFLGLSQATDLIARGLKEAPRYLEHGVALFQGGIRDFAEWSKRMLSTFGSTVEKWLGDMWIRIVDAGERWAERQSETTKRFLTEAFPAGTSQFGPRRIVQMEDARRAVQEQAAISDTLRAAAKAADVPPEGFLRSSKARAIEEELAMTLSTEAPAIDVGNVKPDSPLGKLYNLGINLARVGQHVPERAKQEQAYLQRVMELLSDRNTPLRAQEVLRQALPLMEQTPGEVIAQVQRKLGHSLTYGEAYAIRNFRDILARNYVAAKDILAKAAVEHGAGRMSAADYESALREAASSHSLAANAALVAANQGTYGARMMAFQRLITSDKPYNSFRDRFISSSREGLGISQEAAEELYKAYDLLSKGQMTPEDYMAKLHATQHPTMTDQAIELLRGTLFTPMSFVSMGGANELGLRLSRLERALGSRWAPVTRKLLGWSESMQAALGPEQANYPMPRTLLTRAASEASRENWGLLQDSIPRILKMEPFDPRIMGAGSFEGFHTVQGAIPGKAGEFIRAPFKLAETLDRHTQNRALAEGIYQHAWNMAVRDVKAEGGVLNEADLMRRTLEHVSLMKQVGSDIEGVYARHGSENTKAFLERYSQPLADAHADARRVTLANGLTPQEQPYFRGIAGVGSALGEAVKGSFLGSLFFPFTRTPTNAVIAALLHTPMGFAKINEALRAGRITPERWERDIIKPLLGSTIMAGLLPFAMDGSITGGGPGDPKKEQLLRETGWQPYSVRIGDQYFSYSKAEPLRALLGFIGDIGEATSRGDFKDAQGEVQMGKLAKRALGSVSENLTNQTFLSGLEGLFTAFHDPERYGERLAKQLSGTTVPNMLGYIPIGSLGRAMDPYIRQTSVWTAPLAKLPFVNESLPVQTSPIGTPREKTGTAVERLVSPFQRSTVQTDPESEVARELDRIDYVPSRPPAFLNIGGRKVFLNQQEVDQLDKAQQQATLDLRRFMRSGAYQSAPEHEPDTGAMVKTKRELVEDFYRKQRSTLQQRLRPQLEARLRRHEIGEAVR